MEEKRREEWKAERPDRVFALLYFMVAYGFIHTFSSFWNFERNLAVFTVLYTAVVLAYVTAKGRKPPKESWFWLLVVLALGISYAFWSILYVLQVLALFIAAAYWTLSVTGRLIDDRKTSHWIWYDLLNAGVILPFSNFTCQWRLVLGGNGEDGSEESRRDRKKELYSVILGVVLAIPALLIIIPLLSSADMGFELALGRIADYISEHLMGNFLRFLFSLPVGAYLFGLVYGGISGRNAGKYQREELAKKAEYARILPDVTVCTVLGILSFFYCLFILLQAKYLFSAFGGILPEGYVYAAYARRGFFELCMIAGFNLALLTSAGLLSEHEKERNAGLRFFNVLLSALTLILILTAMSKLVMYIDVYGLTVDRILPMVFMFWMTLVFIAFVIRQKKQFPLVRICVMAGAVFFSLLCVLPVERLVTSYNIWARAAGLIQ